MRNAALLFGHHVRVHRYWVQEDLPGERVLSEFRVRLRAMGEDGGEVPACGCTPDEETFGEVRVEATSVLLGLAAPVSVQTQHICRYVM